MSISVKTSRYRCGNLLMKNLARHEQVGLTCHKFADTHAGFRQIGRSDESCVRNTRQPSPAAEVKSHLRKTGKNMGRPANPLPLTSSRADQIFPALTSDQMQRIAAYGQQRPIHSGEVLIEQGDKANPCCVEPETVGNFAI